MSFFSGLAMGGLNNAVSSISRIATPRKAQGGLFGSGISGQQVVDALGSFGGMGQQQPIQHAQFQQMQFAPVDYGQPMMRRQAQPLDLSRYLYPGGYY